MASFLIVTYHRFLRLCDRILVWFITHCLPDVLGDYNFRRWFLYQCDDGTSLLLGSNRLGVAACLIVASFFCSVQIWEVCLYYLARTIRISAGICPSRVVIRDPLRYRCHRVYSDLLHELPTSESIMLGGGCYVLLSHGLCSSNMRHFFGAGSYDSLLSSTRSVAILPSSPFPSLGSSALVAQSVKAPVLVPILQLVRAQDWSSRNGGSRPHRKLYFIALRCIILI